MKKVTIYTKESCPYCRLAKELLISRHIEFEEYRIDLDQNKLAEMTTLSKQRTVPQIFIDGEPIGGYDNLAELAKTGKLDKLLES